MLQDHERAHRDWPFEEWLVEPRLGQARNWGQLQAISKSPQTAINRYSITSSALNNIDVGKVSPSARAVTKLATSLKRRTQTPPPNHLIRTKSVETKPRDQPETRTRKFLTATMPSTRAQTRRKFSGKALFYSYRAAKTATGSPFDRNQMTAAHRSLPFGTKVRVTDLLQTGRWSFASRTAGRSYAVEFTTFR